MSRAWKVQAFSQRKLNRLCAVIVYEGPHTCPSIGVNKDGRMIDLNFLAEELHTYVLADYVAWVRFGIRVRVRVWDSAIFEKGGCGCGETRRLKNIFIYIFNILLSIRFHIIQTYTKFKSNSR